MVVNDPRIVVDKPPTLDFVEPEIKATTSNVDNHRHPVKGVLSKGLWLINIHLSVLL